MIKNLDLYHYTLRLQCAVLTTSNRMGVYIGLVYGRGGIYGTSGIDSSSPFLGIYGYGYDNTLKFLHKTLMHEKFRSRG